MEIQSHDPNLILPKELEFRSGRDTVPMAQYLIVLKEFMRLSPEACIDPET
jgi:hypothetical protein